MTTKKFKQLKRNSPGISNTYVHFSLLHLENCQEFGEVLSYSHFCIKNLDPILKGLNYSFSFVQYGTILPSLHCHKGKSIITCHTIIKSFRAAGRHNSFYFSLGKSLVNLHTLLKK